MMTHLIILDEDASHRKCVLGQGEPFLGDLAPVFRSDLDI